MTYRDEQRLTDIADALDAIQAHLARGDLADALVFDAVRIRLLEIGEAVKALPPSITQAESAVRWSQIARMRDHLAHRYFDTSPTVVRATVTHDLPPLADAVFRLRTPAHPSHVRVRPADTRDTDRVATIHVDAWRAAYRDILPTEFLETLSVTDRAARWSDTIADADSTTLVAESHGQVVGFAHVCPARDDDLDPTTTGELTAIYLAPDRRRQGLGTALISAARAALTDAGHGAAALWVLRPNLLARRFYARDWWQPDGRVERATIGGLEVEQVRLTRRLA